MDKKNLTTNCPPPSIYQENTKPKKKLNEKKYFLFFEKIKYELIISLFDNEYDKEEKIFNFKLINSREIDYNKNIYYENNKNLQELTKLFLINVSKCNNPINKIFEKIEKFHSNNSAYIQKNSNSENSLDLVYTLTTLDNEEIEFVIELLKKEEIISKEKKEYLLYQEINFLKNTLINMENKYEKIIKEQNNEIKLLKEKIDFIMNNSINYNYKKKIINEEEQLICKSDLSLFNNIKIIKAEIDGGRGVNDHFEVYNLYKNKKSVFIAVKCKEEDSDISFIDIIKITSIDNYKKIKRLKGHQKRIVFIKYFIDPYLKKEYLLSGDREEVIRVWEIIDEKNYKPLCVINTNYGRLIMQQSIYNCILYFTENKKYIYTTTVTKNYSRLYELENGAFLKDISITYYNYTFYLLKYKDLIVDVCKNYVIIYNPFNELIYAKIESDQTIGDNRSACIIYNNNNTDYLYISNSNGYIIDFDLKKKTIITFFCLGPDLDLYHITFWDYNHLIVAEYNTDYLEIINIEKPDIKKIIKCNSSLMCVKKILLNEKEEILLTSGENNKNIYILFSGKKLETPLSSRVNEKVSTDN